MPAYIPVGQNLVRSPDLAPEIMIDSPDQPLREQEILGFRYLGGTVRYSPNFLESPEASRIQRQSVILAAAGVETPAIAELLDDDDVVAMDVQLAAFRHAVLRRQLRRSGFVHALRQFDPPLVTVEGSANRPNLQQLPPDEAAVMAEVSTGSTNPDIARALAMSPRKVREHMDSIRLRFGTSSRELIAVTYHIANASSPEETPLN